MDYFPKERKLINKIGLSIYSQECLDNIDLKLIDIIQLPLSLYDQRVIHSGLIDSLIEKDISIYARSIYLQGLLLASLDDWPLWISKASRNHHQFLLISQRKKQSQLKLAVDFAKTQKYLDSLVAGFANQSILQIL